ncbi:MAG: hypothetical protein ACKO37_04040 [Vampirovibrionales bacterium]
MMSREAFFDLVRQAFQVFDTEQGILTPNQRYALKLLGTPEDMEVKQDFDLKLSKQTSLWKALNSENSLPLGLLQALTYKGCIETRKKTNRRYKNEAEAGMWSDITDWICPSSEYGRLFSTSFDEVSKPLHPMAKELLLIFIRNLHNPETFMWLLSQANHSRKFYLHRNLISGIANAVCCPQEALENNPSLLEHWKILLLSQEQLLKHQAFDDRDEEELLKLADKYFSCLIHAKAYYTFYNRKYCFENNKSYFEVCFTWVLHDHLDDDWYKSKLPETQEALEQFLHQLEHKLKTFVCYAKLVQKSENTDTYTHKFSALWQAVIEKYHSLVGEVYVPRLTEEEQSLINSIESYSAESCEMRSVPNTFDEPTIQNLEQQPIKVLLQALVKKAQQSDWPLFDWALEDCVRECLNWNPQRFWDALTRYRQVYGKRYKCVTVPKRSVCNVLGYGKLLHVYRKANWCSANWDKLIATQTSLVTPENWSWCFQRAIEWLANSSLEPDDFYVWYRSVLANVPQSIFEEEGTFNQLIEFLEKLWQIGLTKGMPDDRYHRVYLQNVFEACFNLYELLKQTLKKEIIVPDQIQVCIFETLHSKLEQVITLKEQHSYLYQTFGWNYFILEEYHPHFADTVLWQSIVTCNPHEPLPDYVKAFLQPTIHLIFPLNKLQELKPFFIYSFSQYVPRHDDLIRNYYIKTVDYYIIHPELFSETEFHYWLTSLKQLSPDNDSGKYLRATVDELIKGAKQHPKMLTANRLKTFLTNVYPKNVCFRSPFETWLLIQLALTHPKHFKELMQTVERTVGIQRIPNLSDSLYNSMYLSLEQKSVQALDRDNFEYFQTVLEAFLPHKPSGRQKCDIKHLAECLNGVNLRPSLKAYFERHTVF